MGRDQAESRTLVVGAGAAGRMVAEEMRLRPEHGYRVVGFLDDDPSKLGSRILDIPVLGSISDLVDTVKTHDVRDIVIAIPSASGHTIREVVRLCEEAGASFKIVPGVWEIILGDVTISQLREVRPEDLLGRQTVSLDLAEMTEDLRGKRILITGAGGSIGSELARQVAAFDPGKILLMGRGGGAGKNAAEAKAVESAAKTQPGPGDAPKVKDEGAEIKETPLKKETDETKPGNELS